MAPTPVLVFDLGPNLGDNCRGFILLKAFAQAHPELEVTCWLTPEVETSLGQLLRKSRAVDKFIAAPRPPRRTFQINQEIFKYLAAQGRAWTWSACPPGQGPDGQKFAKVIPTGEPWLSAKLLHGQDLDSPEKINQAEFLAAFLDLSQDQAAQSVPLFGSRVKPERFITLGLCRPDPEDPKQLPPSRRDRVWQAVLDSGLEVKAVDLQDWAPPPKLPRVQDLRSLSLAEKVDIFNKSALHIGSDGGLLHFAAACGCPTLGFYAGPGHDPGRVFSPWPVKGPWGKHMYANNFNRYIETLIEKLNFLSR
ncbi:MAG: hypothetical protein JRJ59_02400 [Deltaproteobacteria bacterium]|nr:hypothetical protein [Deltaproteobacteria bacterium]